MLVMLLNFTHPFKHIVELISNNNDKNNFHKSQDIEPYPQRRNFFQLKAPPSNVHFNLFRSLVLGPCWLATTPSSENESVYDDEDDGGVLHSIRKCSPARWTKLCRRSSSRILTLHKSGNFQQVQNDS